MAKRTPSDLVMQALPKGWQESILKLYAAGASDVEVQAELKLHINLWRELMGDEEFAEVIGYGRQLSKAFWYSMPRKNLFTKEFNATLYKTYMSNNYGWSDKQSLHESDDSFEKAMNDDELMAKLDQKLNRLKAVK
jgi:hypothetical protein